MYSKTSGIVLSTIKYSDSKLISQIFTEQFGKRSFIFRISNKKKSTKKYGAFQAMNFLDLEFNHKENANLQQLTDWKVSYLYHNIPYDDIKRTVVLFLSELLAKVLRSETSNKELFTFFSNALQYYDLQESNYSNFHLWFLIQLSKFLGFGPAGNNNEHRYFDLIEGVFTSIKPIHPKYLEGELFLYFRKFLNIGLIDYQLISINRNTRTLLLDKIIEYYILQYDELSDIKSLSILKEIFS